VAACVSPSWDTQDNATDNVTPDTAYDFSWRLSGERAIAPLQVFDDGRRTWLHFAPGQPLPAIFAVGRGGERPVPYRRRDPYVVIDGVWPALIMRGGNLRAMARRQAAAAFDETADPAAALVPAADATADSPAAADGAVPAPHASTPAFHAEITDGNLRQVLVRWAGLAGWTFGPEHWDVDVDIPLAGGASFGDDFKQAVRALVSATEMAERPLQPCFYANHVLRVVPYAQACDRAATREAAT